MCCILYKLITGASKTRSYIYITTFNIKVHTISILVDIDVRVSVRGNTCRLVTTWPSQVSTLGIEPVSREASALSQHLSDGVLYFSFMNSYKCLQILQLNHTPANKQDAWQASWRCKRILKSNELTWRSSHKVITKFLKIRYEMCTAFQMKVQHVSPSTRASKGKVNALVM